MNVSQEIQAHFKKLDQLQLDEADQASNIAAIIQFNLLGDQGSHYGLRIHNNQISTGLGYAKAPDLIITMPAEDFLAIVKGEANQLSMAMGGRIEIEGDKVLAMRVASILAGK